MAWRTTRLVLVGTVLQAKMMSRSFLFVVANLLQPLVFATIALYLFRSGSGSVPLLHASIGAGFMGIWTSTLFGSGSALTTARHEGTLEVMVAAPAPLLATLLPITIATAIVGLYSLMATLLWGWLLFGVPLTLAHSGWFLLAVLATVASLGTLGVVLASTFVLYRSAGALATFMEYPVWMLSGVLFPTSLLPHWAQVLSWFLAPTWGVRAVHEAALDGSPTGPLLACVALGVAYLLLGAVALRAVERRALVHGTLALS